MTQKTRSPLSRTKTALLESRSVLRLTGTDTVSFLQGLVTQNVENLDKDTAVYALLLTPRGKCLFDFFLYREAEGFLLDCERTQARALAQRLLFYTLRADVRAFDVRDQWAVCAAWNTEDTGGADNTGTPPFAGPLFREALHYADPRLPALGSRAFVPRRALDIHKAQTDFETEAACDAHRIALGVPQGSSELIPEHSFPLEAGLDELHGIDFQKGCFVGQEVTSRTKRRGKVRKRILPLHANTPLEPGTPLQVDGKNAGSVLATAGGKALGLVKLEYATQTFDANGIPVTAVKPDWARFTTEQTPQKGGPS